MPIGITRVITVVIETVETLVLWRRGAPSEGPAATPQALDERIALTGNRNALKRGSHD